MPTLTPLTKMFFFLQRNPWAKMVKLELGPNRHTCNFSVINEYTPAKKKKKKNYTATVEHTLQV